MRVVDTDLLSGKTPRASSYNFSHLKDVHKILVVSRLESALNNNNNLLRYFHIYTWRYLSNVYE